MTKQVEFNSSCSTAYIHQGLVQVYTGNGKGKTTAALGVILRALGHGLRVYIAFFMKGNYPYGERTILGRLPNVTSASFGSEELIHPAHVSQEDLKQAQQALQASRDAMLSGKYDLIVLDEINIATAWKLVALDEVIKLIRDRPPNVELILTGREANNEIVKMADLVTEMVKVKHPFDRDIPAREGIDY